jgi:hypothetical protein
MSLKLISFCGCRYNFFAKNSKFKSEPYQNPFLTYNKPNIHSRGKTSLHLALYNKQIAVVNVLLASGASLSVTAQDGLNAKNVAQEAGLFALVRQWEIGRVLWAIRAAQEVCSLRGKSAMAKLPEDMCRLVAGLLY